MVLEGVEWFLLGVMIVGFVYVMLLRYLLFCKESKNLLNRMFSIESVVIMWVFIVVFFLSFVVKNLWRWFSLVGEKFIE